MKHEMKPYGVLCAIDVNDFDQNVIDLAVMFAEQAGVDLDLLHVTLFPDPNNAAWPACSGSPDAVIEDNRRLQAITSDNSNVKIVHHHLSGIPSGKIEEFVERNEPRLLVLGTHGRRGLARILGSVASTMMRRATCPVLVLRQRNNSQVFADLNKKGASQAKPTMQ